MAHDDCDTLDPFSGNRELVPTSRPAPDSVTPHLRRLLRPLVRLMIRCGVTFPNATELMKSLFVEVAAAELGPGDRTDSRVSLLSGVHRKEIRRQRTLPQDEPAPALITRNARLIATWMGSSEFSDATGAPLPLPRSAPEGPSFDRLVTLVTRDIRPRTVLDDWLSQGIVMIDDVGRIRLLQDAFLPRPGHEEQLYYFARNVHDHIAAASANVLAASAPPFVDRCVHYDKLPFEAASAIERMGRTAAQRILLDVNKRALKLAGDEPPPGTPTRRVNFGIYLYVEDEQRT